VVHCAQEQALLVRQQRPRQLRVDIHQRERTGSKRLTTITSWPHRRSQARK
jgi:translation initiation factor 1 (eIF-1/SUI1)